MGNERTARKELLRSNYPEVNVTASSRTMIDCLHKWRGREREVREVYREREERDEKEVERERNREREVRDEREERDERERRDR